MLEKLWQESLGLYVYNIDSFTVCKIGHLTFNFLTLTISNKKQRKVKQ